MLLSNNMLWFGIRRQFTVRLAIFSSIDEANVANEKQN